ncbi:bifunctional UDP-N-acetylglucosamine diphosphorylase/glucosamine-1-phosphate N-acetyltransferase GlmU [Bacillus sonorensis]|uniref:bifunctional UDP-N-acetylglucosamine diphosphorylase/glucosamine-1-phosphate N-acetyltransferase GlmU n=1 Tax=Bacillus sonorensis TaxID=119858 RepID=UPI002DB66D54|nr:bifunctional UDP-N-acetylglucosamine diphosphorylase/glucosamine-1-phosphate N-acetyltransferase GlmU [Bacillus sonorensis]MEC1356570.1 bifunctional UDP-N-acetylglucosamine diphosphorylase/glucosamine-1-phosphate N-acetyltransferase GlmU [Bacillus sonorensis]MEC1427417.1 bifunctional UDP-N-acetylglucosamine diphosphorylase/glucosamine-1-phosphate N-acetyltransferase GlmU [Bacillus sonorensis]MEC1438969.1 bifunctional UDP-N-acetylglucosamine diphosphorylase/glucosamine-1-phosphate N-acetyltran
MDKRFAVVLAAGQGTRMKSKLYKVLHPVCGKPMVEHVVDEALKLSLTKLVTIVGHGAEDVKKQLGKKSEYALQAEQLGTAHAVKQAKSILADEKGTTIVICGDTPLLTAETMEAMLREHQEKGAKVTILTAVAEDPTGYGRIIRNENGDVAKIVEHKDATDEERLVKEINTGTYCFDNEALFRTIEQVSNDNVQGEYYLPDVIEILKNQGETVAAYQTDNFQETLGVNDRVALSQAERYMKRRINKRHMQNGVSLIDPDHTYISPEAVIGRDTVIYPGTVIKGRVVIGEDTVIGQNSELENSTIGSRTVIKQSVIVDSEIGDDVTIGPFAHIRPDSKIGNQVRIGNFVEVKKAQFGDRSKASHLSYIGDAEIGTDVNLGCGSITVNYDGKNKFMTKVEDGAFVGCNSNLIAPVTIGKGAYVAAGSTITDDVPGQALSIARARQVNKEDYAKNKQKK